MASRGQTTSWPILNNGSDDDIFKLIAKLEQEAASLNNISNKPKKLLAKIKEIKYDIDKLVEFVDSRE